jgi:hypothetical protein
VHSHLRGIAGTPTTEFQQRQGSSTQRNVLAGTHTEFLACFCVFDRMGVRSEESVECKLEETIMSDNLLFLVPFHDLLHFTRQGSGALISIWNSPFATFTAFNVLLTFWQLSEVLRKTGHPSRTRDSIWFDKSAHNAILVEFSYLLWMQLQMGTVLYVACLVEMGDFSAFMDAFPKMQCLLSNLALNTAFFNNLAIFVATLLRYKLVSTPKQKNYNVIVFSLPLLSSIWIVWKVLSCFFLSYDGAMSSSFFSLIFEKIYVYV